MAFTFSTSQLTKVVRTWVVLYILTSKCASRHKGVQFFITHLASWLRIRRFSEPTFRPSGAPHHWKNTVFRDFPTFSRICIFFLLTLLSFNLSLHSATSLLCFSSVHIVGSLTSKLPSIVTTSLTMSPVKEMAFQMCEPNLEKQKPAKTKNHPVFFISSSTGKCREPLRLGFVICTGFKIMAFKHFRVVHTHVFVS